MKTDTVYEIRVVGDVKKGSLEELMQMSLAFDIKRVWYAEKEDKKMLISFLATSDSRILGNGQHIVKRAVTEVLFTPIDVYKKLIVYDHFKNIICYTDTVGAKYENTPVIAVVRFPNIVLDEVVESIIEKINRDQQKT
jgi:acid stress-induced BolA-like protein IbaG/YrbA